MSDQFARQLSKVAVAQLCQAVSMPNGDRFAGVQRSAIECLTDLVAKYIDDVGFQSRSLAEHAGRTDVNLIDVRCALAGLRVEFAELERWMVNHENPFAKPTVPAFPARKEATTTPQPFGDDAEIVAARPEHIPPWLPPYPKRIAYEATPAGAPPVTEAAQRRQRNKMKRAVQGSLIRIAHGAQLPPEWPRFGEAAEVDSLLASAKAKPMEAPDVDVIMEGTTRPVAANAAAGGRFGVTPFRLDLQPKPTRSARDSVVPFEGRDKKRQKMQRIMALRHGEEPLDANADEDDGDDDGGD